MSSDLGFVDVMSVIGITAGREDRSVEIDLDDVGFITRRETGSLTVDDDDESVLWRSAKEGRRRGFAFQHPSMT